VNVAFTNRRQGIFDKVDVSNLVVLGAQKPTCWSRLISPPVVPLSLVAPGSKISLANPTAKKRHGSSFAAHVTATVALLQEFGDLAFGGRYCFAS